jgi:hypothetical protein
MPATWCSSATYKLLALQEAICDELPGPDGARLVTHGVKTLL